MKNLSKEDNLEEMISFFSQMQTEKKEIIIWQLNKETNTRIIHFGNLVEVSSNDCLDFQHLTQKEFNFSDREVYFYSERDQLIFKCEQYQNNDDFLSVHLPLEVKILDENESKDLMYGLIDVEEEVGKKYPDLNAEYIRVKGYRFDSENSPDKENPYLEINSEREKISTEYMSHEGERETIVGEKLTHESSVDHLEHKGLDGSTSGGADQVGGSLGGRTQTDRMSSSMGGKGKTEKFSTTEKAGYKGTDKVSTKEHVKNLNNEQSDRDKAIFEEELSFVSLDEEDKFYADKRNAPRAKPKEGKTLIMRKLEDLDGFEGIRYPLFDLSRGGLGAMVDDEDYYSKGEIILIMGFDKNVLDEPMKAIVRSIRESDLPGKFKLGMQFYNEE